jgi:hypothetical protein
VEHLYWDLGSYAGGARFEVELRGSTARVCLMDADDYQAYLDNDDYDYYGGFYDVSPIVMETPYDDYWYLVVDGFPGGSRSRSPRSSTEHGRARSQDRRQRQISASCPASVHSDLTGGSQVMIPPDVPLPDPLRCLGDPACPHMVPVEREGVEHRRRQEDDLL